MMVLYFVSFLDRVNVGFAAFSMNKALHLTPEMFGFGSGVFFAGYILFQVPSNLILLRTGARRWIALVVVAWGLVAMASAFVAGPHSFYVMRFLLGAAESGFFPGTILYLGMWFPARHKAMAVGAFMAAAPLSTAIGSPISGALMKLPTFAGLMNWQWLYIVEALPAIAFGFLTLRVLTDLPDEAKWLDTEERAWLVETLAAERAESTRHMGGGTGSAWKAVLDVRVLALALVYSGGSAGIYALGFWAPLIINQFVSSPLAVGWLNAIPSIVAVVSMVVWARHSDKTQERTWHIVIPTVAAGLGLVWAGHTHSLLSVVIALSIVAYGVNASKGPQWALPNLFLSGSGVAAGIGLINCVGNLGGFVGPQLIGWIKERWGTYAGGLYLIAGMQALSAVVMLIVCARIEDRYKATGGVK
jgi:ACS family tartrate transporter-like MFS transporter